VLLLGAVLAIGLLLGWGLGGSIRELAAVRIRIWWIAPLALALQLTPLPEVEGDVGRLLPAGALILSFVLLLIVAAANWRLRGFILILIGFLMNIAVMTANQGMPVSPEAMARIGAQDSIEALRNAEPGSKHRLAGDDDQLLFLADVIPVGRPFDSVVSLGDVFAYAGGAVFIGSAMLGRPRREPRWEEDQSPQATWS
jgi:hypothetical protein